MKIKRKMTQQPMIQKIIQPIEKRIEKEEKPKVKYFQKK